MNVQELEEPKAKLAKEKAYMEEEVRTEHGFGNIIGESPLLRSVLESVETVAPTDSTVLVCGATGTGKELIAGAVHDLSPRKARTFVKLNCAAIPTGLLESEAEARDRAPFGQLPPDRAPRATGVAPAPSWWRAARRRASHAPPTFRPQALSTQLVAGFPLRHLGVGAVIALGSRAHRVRHTLTH